ncbi:N/A [soil metagenome]
MDAIEMLTKQHRELETSLKAALAAEGNDRRRLFEGCADVLMSHVLVEEQHFYPEVKAKRTEDILLESLEEHLSLKRLMADLEDLSVSDEHFEPKLHVLSEQAKHHHEEEEEKLFPKVKKLLSAAELLELGNTMGAAQALLLANEPRKLAATQKKKAADV